MITRFLLQHTRRPVAPGEVVPDSDWHTVSRHSSESAANKAMNAAYWKMIDRCGASVDDDYRVTPAKDVELGVVQKCWGYVDQATGKIIPCPDATEELICVTWKAKTARPLVKFEKFCYGTGRCLKCVDRGMKTGR